MFSNPFYDLRRHCQRMMQTATVWQVDPKAHHAILANARFGEYRASLDIREPFEFLGIKIEVDPALPENRVVLKAGKNTVGAFTIGHSEEPKE